MNLHSSPIAPSATLDIDVLRSVVAIAESGTIAAAAQRVARTPAAISMQIKKLEEMLGRELFQRTRQGMTPTAEGERLVEYARQMIDLNRTVIQSFAGPELEGDVTVGLIDSFGGVRMARVFAGFARSHPKVTVNVMVATTVNLVPQLDSNQADLILLTPGGAEDWRDGDFVLHEEPLAWIARDGGQAMRQRPVPLAVSEHGCAWRDIATEALQGRGMETRIAYVSDHDSGQVAAAEADLAVAPMPRSYLGPGLIELGAKEGFAPLGSAKVALRMGENATSVAAALAVSIAESYGKVFDARTVCFNND